MAKLWAIVKREYLERVRTRWFVIATVFGPVFFGSLIVIPAYMAKKSKASTEFTNTIILDATSVGIGQKVATAMSSQGAAGSILPNVRVVPSAALTQAESTATKQVVQKQASGYLVLNDQTLKGEEIRYAGRNATSLQDMERLKAIVRQTLLSERLVEAGVQSDKVKELTFMPLRMSAVRITDSGVGGSGAVSIIFAGVVAFLLYMSIVLYGQNVLRGVLEEKTTRVAEVVVSSVPAETLLAGKVLGVGAVGLTQQIIWVAASYMMFKLRAPLLAKFGVTTTPFQMPDISVGLALLLLLFFLLGFTFYASLYAAVGSSVNTEQEAQQAVQPLLVMLVATAVFINPILMNPTGKTATVMSLLPFSAPIIMPLRLAIGSVPWIDLVGSLVALAASCVFAVWLAARIYRVGLLMYGKRPTFKEMGRWISYSS
ncbi:MAG TPA: ABC transporter permease [Gemmatimonadaceae bacterium]|nr:ABC transporter permease [Gemmatimonadaceae bacterium]